MPKRLPIELPDHLSLANLPTPLQPLDRISERYSLPSRGPRIWVKRDDLTESGMSGNKLRKLEFVMAKAQGSGANVLITCGGIQSNHCRATALVGARLGMKVQLILRGKDPGELDGNLLLDKLAGAEVAVYPDEEYSRDLEQLFEKWSEVYQSHGDKPFCIPTGASDGHGIWGYISASEELINDCAEQRFEPSHIVCATGSGGTQAGLTLGCHLLGLQTRVTGYAVCQNSAYLQKKIREDIAHWMELTGNPLDLNFLSVLINDDYRGPGYGLAGVEVYQTIEELARLEGILLDPVYTGKAFHGLLQELQQGNYQGVDNLVFIHTGGQFALFPHRNHFFLTVE
ncbi:D-cysteine desulfhydrase family protein [Microbulbifer sp. OS29]|uniref:D-cysteine desulfhydrase family protein n=1 Tax=Microbulbifer okhotskensis TaxID=2926617 RepID=A0A9X2J712_9GAMM|nr:D-cysteine desulfhydrase family protein [Microbulbifer okhotskensis]MCO1333976.1 D-cysteine desulfhydrase family protein [Microbulbifer okhotskensis]